MIGCIGKCTSGLTREVLDQITDDIIKTLTHPLGREIFRKYLEKQGLSDNLECLNLYEICSGFIEKEQNKLPKDLNLESLRNDVRSMKKLLENLDGVSQVDLTLLKRFNEALDSKSIDGITILAILKDTRAYLGNHLRLAHGDFKRYASEPCPMTR